MGDIRRGHLGIIRIGKLSRGRKNAPHSQLCASTSISVPTRKKAHPVRESKSTLLQIDSLKQLAQNEIIGAKAAPLAWQKASLFGHWASSSHAKRSLVFVFMWANPFKNAPDLSIHSARDEPPTAVYGDYPPNDDSQKNGFTQKCYLLRESNWLNHRSHCACAGRADRFLRAIGTNQI